MYRLLIGAVDVREGVFEVAGKAFDVRRRLLQVVRREGIFTPSDAVSSCCDCCW